MRRLNVVAAELVAEEELAARRTVPDYTQPDLFDIVEGDVEAQDIATHGAHPEPEMTERHVQRTILDIKRKFGNNAVIKGMDLFDDATGQRRNNQIGGHAA